MKKVQLYESFIGEAFEVHYSDGVRAAKKFKTEKDAMSFTKEKIASGKCKEIAVYKAGPGFHSTADTDAVVAWWGDGSYLDNVSKKDDKLAAKKIDESLVIEAKAKGLDWVISELGDKPKCYDVASFVYDNYDKVTGLRKSMRNEEMDFPEEIMDVVDHYGLDIDEFTDCYGMAAESFLDAYNKNSEKLDEAGKFGAPAGLSKAETKKVAEVFAKAISKHDGVKCTVNSKSLEPDSFDLDMDGEEYAGGSYIINLDGDVINMAVPGGETYGKMDSSVDDIVKNLKKLA